MGFGSCLGYCTIVLSGGWAEAYSTECWACILGQVTAGICLVNAGTSEGFSLSRVELELIGCLLPGVVDKLLTTVAIST